MVEIIIIAVLIVVVLMSVSVIMYLRFKSRDKLNNPQAEIKPENIEALAAYVKAQKDESEQKQRLKDLKKEDMKQKLETFKQTRQQLKDKLKNQIDKKDWKSLESVLNSADKGGVGIYILFNETKNKYYVGQAKQIFKRIKDHFIVEDIAKDYLNGDKICVKFLTANELDADYRLDHIEKTGIEIFNSDKNGYNRTNGNIN